MAFNNEVRITNECRVKGEHPATPYRSQVEVLNFTSDPSDPGLNTFCVDYIVLDNHGVQIGRWRYSWPCSNESWVRNYLKQLKAADARLLLELEQELTGVLSATVKFVDNIEKYDGKYTDTITFNWHLDYVDYKRQPIPPINVTDRFINSDNDWAPVSE